MKSILTKKVLIIVSVISFIVIGAVVLAFATGNTYYPSLTNPDGVFYQRVDSEGNVIYTITNEELFEEIKGNDGIQQLLFMTDSVLLSEYINQVTQTEIDDKILQLTYGTSDTAIIDDIEDDIKVKAVESFTQSMVLAGFQDNEDEYAKLIVAREKFVMELAIENETITDESIALAYLSEYFDDISAIKIQFTSKDDADFVLQKFNFVSLGNLNLREYKGWTYRSETLFDPLDELVEAYQTIDVYYFNDVNNIVDTDGNIIYELGANDIYTDADDLEYTINLGGDLVNAATHIVVKEEVLFDDLESAVDYKEANTEYYVVTRDDPYDMDETINVINALDEVVFTIDPTGHIFDATDTDVTYTTDLYVNKVYKAIEDLTLTTSNNSRELTEAEVLAGYIEMYNYVYGIYRETLPVDATIEELVALDNEFLQFNFDEEYANNPVVTDYLFNQLSLVDEARYSEAPQLLQTSKTNYYYMAYKLTEPTKEDMMSTLFDYLEPLIVIPTIIGDSIELPTTTYYDGTITWSSSDSDIITNAGVVTTPEADEDVTLTYTISVLGVSRAFMVDVKVLADGETVEVTEPNWTEVSLEEIINDPTAYDYLYNKLLDDYIYGTDSESNINDVLQETRIELGFNIYDRYLGMDYQAMDATFDYSSKGDKNIMASFDKTLTSDEPYEVTADQFYEFALTKNAALYTLYAAQYKELINSDYYTEVFGTQTNIAKNKSDRMDDMYDAITSTKEYYSYLQQLYGQYGMEFGYASFSDYAYSQYNTKTELALLKYFVAGEIQPYLIDETIDAKNAISGLYPSVQEYYENYFSLNVTHVLIHVDYDDDSSPDDYYEYKDSLTVEELAAFDSLQAGLEIAIDEFDGTFTELIEAYNEATREDDTWGIYKQNGFLILTEDLNIVDSEDDTIVHSLTYSGEYGIKDNFVSEYVDALIALYQEYQLEQNLDKTELYSDLVVTEFGIHIIKATQGDDFEKPTCDFEEEDPLNPEYSDGSENSSEAPSLEQMQLYAQYRFYSMVYDLSDTDLEENLGITIPYIPTSVSNAYDVYLADLLGQLYVVGTVNVNMAERLYSGNFVDNSYTVETNDDLLALLQEIGNIYDEAIFGDYVTE
ncbi:hypothetical protein RJI07_07340 [Mycoplasmatota bacterium WC30]